MDSDDYEEYDDDDSDENFIRMTPTVQTLAAIGIGILILITVTGNIITIIAYINDKRLHTVYDTYIFNLAITDLLIGCISMPFYAVYTCKEFVWVFGYHFCKFWLVVDFTICLETVLMTLLLSVDRLQLITYGPHYTSKVTITKASIAIFTSWILAFMLYSPFIIAWDHVSGYSTVEDMDCDVEFAYNFKYTTTTAIIEFVLPVTCLAILNSMIYYKISIRLRCSATIQPVPERLNHSSTNSSLAKCDISNIPERNGDTKIRFDPISSGKTLSNGGVDADFIIQQKTLKKMNSRLRRDYRAARFLAMLVVVFLVCWAPYTITTIVISFCTDDCINMSGYESLNWLLWSKSAINPFLYALNSSRYKYNFRKYLMCWKKHVMPVNTETTINTAA